MKPTDFHLFGPPHIAILLALCLIAFTLIRLRLPRTAQALALFLTLDEIIWYTDR